MSITMKVARYEASNVARSRWLLVYTLFFLAATESLLRFAGSGTKALLSLMSVVLFLVPLVTVVYGTVYLYSAREFTELLLAQPMKRGQLFAGLYLGLTVPLSLGLAAGLGLPFLFHGADDPAIRTTLTVLILAGTALTSVFTAFAFLIALRCEDRLRGLGAAIGLWLLFALVYDGLLLFLLAAFADYPLERPVLALILANPVDLARVILLLQFDISALMGYTGAVFQRFFGSAWGAGLAASALALWMLVPIALGFRAFARKDF
ncbi:MAG TPA: ABC transporter permease subunit [Gemmatimonadaceae bacterium]